MKGGGNLSSMKLGAKAINRMLGIHSRDCELLRRIRANDSSREGETCDDVQK